MSFDNPSIDQRIKAFLEERHLAHTAVTSLTGDASTRSFFRVPWPEGSTAVMMVYASPGDPSE
ncbi:hypothetical protein ACFLU6_14775, partial [Acidobacteriota bacterium]